MFSLISLFAELTQAVTGAEDRAQAGGLGDKVSSVSLISISFYQSCDTGQEERNNIL